MKRFAVIMAGGSGTRFWPKSSQAHPKQLLNLTSQRSLLQMTDDRLLGLIDKDKRWIVGTKLLERATKKQLPKAKYLGEPEGRNTMAAVCLGVWTIFKKDPESSVAILPADASVLDGEGYRKSLAHAFDIAENEDRIVCLGIKPTFAATGYGYIEAGTTKIGGGHQIKRFIEKPNGEKAREFFSSGLYLWNAGIFVFKCRTFMNEVRNLAPEFAKYFDQIAKSPSRTASIYKKLPKTPLDIAIMEKTSLGVVIAGDFGWNDLGSWPALEEVMRANSPAGTVQALGGHFSIDSKRNIVDVTGKKFVALIGVNDLIVVETEKALLVCEKSRAQEIKDLVTEIEKNPKLKKKLL